MIFQTFGQFLDVGCDNCENVHLKMKGKKEQVEEYTTSQFGFVPNNWIAGKSGFYAINVDTTEFSKKVQKDFVQNEKETWESHTHPITKEETPIRLIALEIKKEEK